jgi:hypothetical protein
LELYYRKRSFLLANLGRQAKAVRFDLTKLILLQLTAEEDLLSCGVRDYLFLEGVSLDGGLPSLCL